MDEQESLALRESEELHRITLINMSDAVFITDDGGAFTFICPNVDVIFGHSRADVQGIGRIAALLGRDLVDLAELRAAGEIRNIEHEVVTKSGRRRTLLIHIKQVAIRRGTVLYVCRDVTERKDAERALRRNQERLTLALEAASMGTWDWDVPSGDMTWSPETHRIFGDPAGACEPSFDIFLQLLHPADRDRVSEAMTDAMARAASYETEFRIRGYDDVERWVLGKGKAWRNGKPLRMLGVFVDFTDRHRVDRELRELGGKLINAHEQERGRLSRELHDDFAQRVALLSTELGLLRGKLGDVPHTVDEEFAALSAQSADIGVDLHRLSHELHPARLLHLGLDASIRAFCREIAEARGLDVGVRISDLPDAMSPDVALCLYRVAQEALHNTVKHSGARRAVVAVASAQDEVFLSVSDDGAGFDQSAAHAKDSIGLISMRERARLVRGRLLVVSRPGEGTRVEIRVPVARA